MTASRAVKSWSPPFVVTRSPRLERREVPRRVADRSVAMRTSASSWAWLWVLLAVLGGIGGGVYYWKAKGFAPGNITPDVTSDSLPTAESMPPKPVPAAQTPATPVDSARP